MSAGANLSGEESYFSIVIPAVMMTPSFGNRDKKVDVNKTRESKKTVGQKVSQHFVQVICSSSLEVARVMGKVGPQG